MTRIRFLIVVCCLALACTKEKPPAEKEKNDRERPLRVAVASNFAATSEALARAFERKSKRRVELSFGSTGKLFAQLENGAPFDVFLAADAERPRLLGERGRAVVGSQRAYAVGRLALYGKALKHPDDGKLDLTTANAPRLAIANPETAPYGAAARQVLERLGVWTALSSHVVMGENISQTFQFVETGAADLGLVAMSSLVGKGEHDYWRVPASLHAPIRQDAVAVGSEDQHPDAAAFLDFLGSHEALELIRAAGYDAP